MSEIALIEDPEDPSVLWAQSRSEPNHFYRIDNAEGLWPRCRCPAALHGAECGHVLALLEQKKTEGTAMAEMEERALVPARPSAAASVTTRAQNVRAALAATRGGFDEAMDVAVNVIGRDAWPDELRNDQAEGARKAALIVMTAAELGVAPTQAFSYITAIKGKPFLMARMVNALVSARVPGGYIIPTSRTITDCTVVARRPGRPDVTITVTIEQARRAGWTNNKLYETNPAAMLTARATTTAGWLQFPDVLAGMDAAEEVDGQTVPFFVAEVEQVPSHAIRTEAGQPPLEHVEGEIVPESPSPETKTTPEPSAPPAASHESTEGVGNWIDELADLMKVLKVRWGDVAAVLDLEIHSRRDVQSWRDDHPEIADPVTYIRDGLLRRQAEPAEQVSLPAV